MALSTEVSYSGYGNLINLVLQIDGATMQDHRDIVWARLEFGRGPTLLSPDPYLEIDSIANPLYFDFTNAGKLVLNLGVASIPKGRHNVTLTIFTGDYPSGLSFGTSIDLRMS